MTKISSNVNKWKRRLSKERKEFSVEVDLSREEDGATNHFTEVLIIEDLAFLIATYLVPKRNPCSMQEMMSNLMFVSRNWYKSFSLVRAQMRYDFLVAQVLVDNDSQGIIHKIQYIPQGTGFRSVPPEGCLRIFRSNVNETCKEAMYEYRTNRNNDESIDQRIDSRPDYYYKAHRETATCLELVPPKALPFQEQFNLVNEVEYDQKPRLISQYWATVGDVNGIVHSPGCQKSQEGRLDLGYHEIISVRESRNATLKSRPPLNSPGPDSTEFLKTCNAKAFDAPRWVRFAHVVGEDRCRLFLQSGLLPMVGSRPTGNTWYNRRRQQHHRI